MTEKEIRDDTLQFVNNCYHVEPNLRTWSLIAQSVVVAIYEVAAQLAHLNENGIALCSSNDDIPVRIKPI
jgi:hypothetical protein